MLWSGRVVRSRLSFEQLRARLREARSTTQTTIIQLVRSTFKFKMTTHKRARSPRTNRSSKRTRDCSQEAGPSHYSIQQDTWSLEDEMLLQATNEGELRLWRRAQEIFGCSPHDLIPAGYNIDTSENNSTNLGMAFCDLMTRIILTPAFQDLRFLHLAIDYAMYLRIANKDEHPKPDTYSAWAGKHDKVVERMVECLGVVQDRQVRDMYLILEQEIGPERPPHFEFFQTHLRDKAGKFQKKKQNAMKGAIVRDLRAIEDAWDEFASLPGSPYSDMKTYQERYRMTLGRFDPGILAKSREMKKCWIISCREQGRERSVEREVETEARSRGLGSREVPFELLDFNSGMHSEDAGSDSEVARGSPRNLAGRIEVRSIHLLRSGINSTFSAATKSDKAETRAAS
jgi:hypothetical protein